MNKYPSSMIANAFATLHRKNPSKSPLFNHMAVQKLCYLVYAWSLALRDDHPFEDKPIASQYGPVFENLYHALKREGNDELTFCVKQYYPPTEKWTYLQPASEDTDVWDIITQVWDRYGHFDPQALSVSARGENSPWETAYANKVRQLDENEIRTYYRAKLKPEQPKNSLYLVVDNEKPHP